MTTLYTEDFEGSFPGAWAKAGTQQASSTQDTVVFNLGAASYKIDTTGASGTSNLTRTPTAGRMLVMRFYYRLDTAPSVSFTVFNLKNTSADLRFSVTSARILRVGTSSTVQNGPTLTIGQWYLVDARFDSSGSTATIDWKVDGSAQTQYTNVQTAADFGQHQLGATTSNTIAMHFDDLMVTDTSGDYPIGAAGASTNAPAENAAGTGASNAAAASEKPNAGNSAGTGTAYVIAASEKPSAGAAAGTGAANAATVTTAKIASAELASGTGQAASEVSSALIVGSGAAAGISTVYVADAEANAATTAPAGIATGTGAAYLAAMSLQPNAAAALGTETLASLVTDAFGRSVSSGLGNADSGQAWTATGTATDYNVASGAATFGHTAVTQARRAWLPSVVTHDVDHTIKWKGPLPTTSEHNVFIQLRQTSADGDYLMPRLVVNTDLSMNLALMRRAVAVETVLASATLPNTFQADTYYSIRTRLMGQGYFGKVWKSSDSEPTNWQVVVTENQLTAPGGIGMRTYSPSATYPITYSFDDLSVSEIRGNQAYNPTITASSLVTANAIAAVGTGAVNTSTAALLFPSAAAAGTGAAATPSFDTQASTATPAGTGNAYGSASAFLAYAGLPAGTGAAGSLSSLVSFPAFTSEGSGDAFNTQFYTVAASEVAQGVGQAFDTTTVPISSFSGFGTLTYRSAGAVLTFGGR